MSSIETRPVIRTVAPYIGVRGGTRAIEFYRQAFGATVTMGPYLGPDGRVGHAELEVEGSMFMLADEYTEEGMLSPQSAGGTPVLLSLNVADVDAFVQRAEAAGATITRPVVDKAYGSRMGALTDPFGHRWIVNTVTESLTNTEVSERLADDGWNEPGAPGEPAVHLGERQTAPQASKAQTPSAQASAPGPAPASEGAPDGSLHYFVVGTEDAARARAFFSGLFGWELAPGNAEDGWHITNTRPPGGVHGGNERSSLSVWFRVGDVRAAVGRVEALGGRADDPVLYPSGWSARCFDDQGLEFNLVEPAPGYE